jgi:hypothetical protein
MLIGRARLERLIRFDFILILAHCDGPDRGADQMKVEFKSDGKWQHFAYASELIVVRDYVLRLQRQGFEVRVLNDKGEVIR